MAQEFETPFADNDAREIAATNHPDLREVFLKAAHPDVTPDQSAHVLKLSAAADQSPQFVGDNLKSSEMAARSRQLDALWGEIDEKRPVSRNFLSLTSNMAVSHDDIPGLVKQESMIQAATEWARVKAAHFELATLSQEYTASRYDDLHGVVNGDKPTGNPIFDLARLRPTRLAAKLLGVTDNQPDVFGAVPRTRQLQTRMEAIQKTLPTEERVSNDMVEAVPFLMNMIAASAGGATVGAAAGVAVGAEGGPLALITGALGARWMQHAASSDFFFRHGYVATYDRLSAERDASGQPIPEDRIRIAATINGGLQAGLNFVELGKLLPSGVVPPKLLKSLTKPEALKKFLGDFLGNSVHAGIAMGGNVVIDNATDEYVKAFQNARGADFQHTTLTKALTDTLKGAVSGAVVFSPLSALSPALGLRSAMSEINRSRKTREVLTDMMKGRDESKVNKRLPALYEKFNGDALRDTPQENVHVDREAAERLFQQDGIDPAKQFESMGLLQEYELAKATGEPIKIPTAKWIGESVPSQLPSRLLDDTKFHPEHKTVNEIRRVVEEEAAKIEEQGKVMAEAQEQAAEALASDPALKAAHVQIATDARARLADQIPDSLGVRERDKWLDANAKIVADHYLVESMRRKNVDAAQLYAAEFPRVMGADAILTGDGKDAILKGTDGKEKDAAKEAYPQLGPGVDAGRAGEGRGSGRGDGEAAVRPAPEARHLQVLADAPPKGYEGPTPEVRKASEIYLRRAKLPVRQQTQYVKADPSRGARIADAFEAMAHTPNDPVVKAAYDALIKETVDQLHVMREMGVKFEAIKPGQANPYKNSAAMIADVRAGHLWYFPTKDGFGSGPEADRFRDHPLYSETKEKDSNGEAMLANDVFRVVHDFFGHAKEGNGFGANGEENAWQSHVRMYTPEAGRAMTTETRGQNSWVNFHEKSVANRTAPGSVYADQKAGLLPDWVVSEGMAKDSERLFQNEANGEYVPDLNAIILSRKNANPTTLMHEFFHGALKHMFEFVKSGKADQEYLDHWAPMAKFLGIMDDQTKLSVDQQERGARAWERYLRGEEGGRAPSESLADTFSLLRKWFTRVYRKVEGTPLEQDIPVDVRNFFDRLLATDDEIARAEAESGYNATEIADLQDAPPEARRQLRTDQERARRQAEETLLREQMAELRDENKKVLDEKRAEFTASATAEIKGQPVYQAMEELRGLGDKTAFGHDLTPRTVAEQFLNDKLSAHSKGVMEVIAEVYGFADGTDLARRVLETTPPEQAIKGKVAESMAPFADLRNSEAIREAALKSIHANRMTELLYLEQKYLEEMMGDKALRAENNARSRFEAGLRAEAARSQAREILGRKPIKEATAFRVYVTAERNAAIRVTKALAAKDQAKAAQAKGEQAMNHALASESLRLRERVAVNQRFLERFIQRGVDLKDMPYGFTRQIDAMLSQFGMLPPKTGAEGTFLKIARDMAAKGEDSDSIANATGFRLDEKSRLVPETLNDLVDRISEDSQIVFIPDSILRGADKLQSEMSPNDLADLKQAVETISNVGRNFQRFISANLKGDVKEAAAMLRASIEKNVGTPYAQQLQVGSQNNSMLLDNIERIKGLPDAAIPSLVNLLTVCEYLDGKDPAGPAKEYIYRPLKQAGDRKLVRYAQMNKDVNALFEKHFTPAALAEYKNRREYFHFLGEKGRYLTHEEILMVALNWGNEGNRDRIRKGFGIDDYQAQAILDAVDHTGWKFAQDVWDYLHTYWPEIVKLETLVNGVEPKGVEPSPVNTRYGAFRGGYFPIAYDFTRSEDAYRTTEQKNALFKQYSSAAAHTDNGHTQARVDSLKRPIRLNMDVLFNHLENVVHDLEFRPAVIDVSRFLRMMDSKGSITRALGVDGMRKITMELKDAASDQGEFLSVGERAFRWFRFNSTFANLALRAFTLPMDMTGNVIISGWEVGAGRTAQAIKDFAMNPGEMKEFVEKNSVRMKNRAMLRDRDIHDISRKWSGEDAGWRQFAFMFQHLSDQAVSIPLWNEVYQRSLEKHGHMKSVEIADDAVTRSFGSGARIDQAGVQKGSEFGKITSMYYSWLSMMFNRAWLEGKVAGLEYDKGNTGAALAIMAKTAFFAWGLQAANENFWRELVRNGQQEDPEGRKRRIISRVAQQPFSYVWLVRDIAGYTIDKAAGQRADYSMTPLEGSIQNIFGPLGQAANIAFSGTKEYDEKFVEASARSAALLLGYPQKLNDMAFNFMDWAQENGEATWRDLLTRRTKK